MKEAKSVRTVRVLVAIPDVTELQEVFLALHSQGFEVMGIAEGQMVWEAIRQEKPQVIVWDSRLEGQEQDGFYPALWHNTAEWGWRERPFVLFLQGETNVSPCAPHTDSRALPLAPATLGDLVLAHPLSSSALVEWICQVIPLLPEREKI
jgi:hypothetical protein